MNKLKSVIFIVVVVLTTFSAKAEEQKLWYHQPANDWNEALPIGNGRMGGMIFGGVEKETIQFNEETLWTGRPHNYAKEGAYKWLDEIRNLLWQDQQSEAEQMANEQFMSQPFGQQAYQSFGTVLLDFPDHKNYTNYQRQLNLENAISSVSYQVDDILYTREMWATNPGQGIIIQLESDKEEQLNFSVSLDSPHADITIFIDGDEVVLRGKANDYHIEKGMDGYQYPKSEITFEARLKVINDGGELIQTDKMIWVKNANRATLQLVAATSFINYSTIGANPTKLCQNYLVNLEDKSYEELKNEHIADYQNLYKRVGIDLGSSAISNRATDARLNSFHEDQDPSMVALLYQYGRYLLISSSREGSQPANLQGIWNDKLAPSWDSKYTININTEMNYWPAEITNLSECAEPLISMVRELAQTGQSVAKEHYNLNGWVAHHNTDIWRGAAPINNADHGIWPTGGAWLSQHLWWHYQFNGNKEYLKNTAYPVLREASRFFADYLTTYPLNTNWLVSGPSNSPEIGGLVMGPTMDHQIIRTLFSNTIEAAEVLGVDSDLVMVLKDKRAKIAPNQIGKHGQLQEWLQDLDDPENEHRHVSHLWGLHPGNEIHPLTTPALAEACKVTLSHRGDGGTGWSRAWKINFWARLLDGDHAFLLLKNLMVPSIVKGVDMNDKGGLYYNLLDAHPPFQIDGNFGATSGVTEMLLQSHLRDSEGHFYQDILPALPTAFSAGTISGIKGSGGFEFTITWENHILKQVEVKSLLGSNLNLRYKGKTISKRTEPGQLYLFDANVF